MYENESIHLANIEYTKPMNEVLAKDLVERNTKGKWVIYNGSPRGKNSNSKLIIDRIIMGMNSQGVENIEVRYLKNVKEHKVWVEDFASVENNLFVFPLYVHAMPGSVMKFFEQLKPINNKDVHMAFLVQSGFPETSQSYYLRPYQMKTIGKTYATDGVMDLVILTALFLDKATNNRFNIIDIYICIRIGFFY